MKKLKQAASVLACGLLVAACQSLDVPFETAPTLSASLSTPGNIETTISSAFKYWMGTTISEDVRQGVSRAPAVGIAGLADEVTAGTNYNWFGQVANKPRTIWDNTDQGAWYNRVGHQTAYTAIAQCNAVLAVLNSGNIKLGNLTDQYPQGEKTDRAKWLCTFVMGASHVWVGAHYNASPLVIDTLPIDLYTHDYRPHNEVVMHGISQIQKAIGMAQKARFDTLPTTWINGTAYTNTDMIKVMYSYMARGLVQAAATPAERAKVDWTKVINFVDSGITGPWGTPFPQANGFVWQALSSLRGTNHFYLNSVSQTGTTATRPSLKFLGPSDTTGAYKWWLANQNDTIFVSPDRRVNGPQTGAPVKGTAGSYFQRLTTSLTASYGTWALSKYQYIRFGTANNFYNTGLVSTMVPAEMDLLKAEALIRLNRASEAVALINKTRQGNGKLPPVDVNGPPKATAAQIASCVPRRDDGSCGDLMDAMLYEKRMENFGIDGSVNFADWRAFGNLYKGSMIFMPIHGRELETLGSVYYSYGGEGTPGSVGTPCLTQAPGTFAIGTIGCISIYP